VAIDREKTLAAAQKYVEKKRYDRAVAEYQKILQEDPNDARTLLKLGDLQSKMEAYAEAVATYERVGKFYAAQGFSLKAIAVYKQIREIIARHVPQLDAKYTHITPVLAELYQALGLTSDALAALDEVATRFQRQGREAEAIDVFRKIVELDPTNPLSHLRLAEALTRARGIDEAVLEFGTASGQLLRLGRRDDALKVFERLLQLKPDPTHARIAAELYLSRNGPNDAMQALAKLQVCFQANRHDLDTLGLLARAFTQIGQAAKAIEVHKEMARIARDTNRTDLFHEIVTKLQKLAPNDEGVRRLAAGGMSSRPPPSQTAPRAEAPARPPPRDVPDDYEDVGESEIDDSDIEDEEQPIELARRAAPAHDDVVVENNIDVVEEVSDHMAPAGSRERIARILSDAASFRRARRLDAAIETLRGGVALAPKALEIHEMLRDLLLDAGEHADAVAEMIEIAEVLVEALDGEEAARSLQDALAIDPGNAAALRMLHDLGYELVEEPESHEAEPVDLVPPPRSAQISAYDPEAPLPSYDLEEIGPEDVARHSSAPAQVAAPPVAPPPRARAPSNIDAIDDPFGDGPLPSFPLDAQEAADAARSGPTAARLSPAAPPRGIPELEAALEEADFFASRGLYDDARTILQEQLARLPNHPLIRDRLEELDAQERSAHGDSGTRPAPVASAVQNRAFDIAESLNGTAAQERSSGVATSQSFGGPTEQVDVEEVFAKFKAGVAQQIAVDDTQSHYDLGVAYKEMGLVDDAIREFDMASRDPKRACVCHSMIGMIQLERGDLNEAIDAFNRALLAPDRTKDQEAALCYEIGSAYEAKKVQKQALDHFQRCARILPSFRDVQERIRRLQKVEPKQPPRAVAVGADDEFDRAFNDIVNEK
jgi:tetratricopeptide (TPR) repeat protein